MTMTSTLLSSSLWSWLLSACVQNDTLSNLVFIICIYLLHNKFFRPKRIIGKKVKNQQMNEWPCELRSPKVVSLFSGIKRSIKKRSKPWKDTILVGKAWHDVSRGRGVERKKIWYWTASEHHSITASKDWSGILSSFFRSSRVGFNWRIIIWSRK